jgi:hypothetical protein
MVQARADLAQHLVAGMVAEGVVELLEPVQVDEQERHLGAILLRTLERRAEAVDQLPAIAETGQIVGDGLDVAQAQPLDHCEPGSRHPEQHGEDREYGGRRGAG